MPAKDLYHDAIKIALINDGWTITDDPLTFKIGIRNLAIDLGAERLLAAERGPEKIAVEVKSFVGPSLLSELEKAWGQFFLYTRTLAKQEPDRNLYLAVNSTTFETLFQEEAGQMLLAEPGFRLFAVDIERQEIILWRH